MQRYQKMKNGRLYYEMFLPDKNKQSRASTLNYRLVHCGRLFASTMRLIKRKFCRSGLVHLTLPHGGSYFVQKEFLHLTDEAYNVYVLGSA